MAQPRLFTNTHPHCCTCLPQVPLVSTSAWDPQPTTFIHQRSAVLTLMCVCGGELRSRTTCTTAETKLFRCEALPTAPLFAREYAQQALNLSSGVWSRTVKYLATCSVSLLTPSPTLYPNIPPAACSFDPRDRLVGLPTARPPKRQIRSTITNRSTADTAGLLTTALGLNFIYF